MFFSNEQKFAFSMMGFLPKKLFLQHINFTTTIVSKNHETVEQLIRTREITKSITASIVNIE